MAETQQKTGLVQVEMADWALRQVRHVGGKLTDTVGANPAGHSHGKEAHHL